MAIKYHPDVGDILICDFSQLKTKEPEIVKKRPVICLTPRGRHGRLCTVVPLSTTAPNPIQLWHGKVYIDLPKPYDKTQMWIKGDLLYSVSMDRLFVFKEGKDPLTGKRLYRCPKLNSEEIKLVHRCVLVGLGMYDVAKKL